MYLDDMADDQVRDLSDAKTLATLANPHRSRIIDILAVAGPSTASVIAQRMDLAIGSVSHHLKVLAEVDLVSEAPELARDRRERWWRLSAPSTRWSRTEFADDASAVSAAVAAESLALQRQFERARDWLARSQEPAESDRGAFANQSWLQLSPEETTEFMTGLVAYVQDWRHRTEHAEDGVERHSVFFFARGFPAEP